MSAASPSEAALPKCPPAQITFSESDADVETIIKTFYERCLADRPEAVRIFIEEELVSYSGARLAQDEKSILKLLRRGMERFRVLSTVGAPRVLAMLSKPVSV